MKWRFNNDTPIYSQLIEHIKLGIITGEFPPRHKAAVGSRYCHGSRSQSQHHAKGNGRA